jgi:hypothetical protein
VYGFFAAKLRILLHIAITPNLPLLELFKKKFSNDFCFNESDRLRAKILK